MTKEALIHIHTGSWPQSNTAGGDLAGYLVWPPFMVMLCPTEPGTRVFTLAQLPKSFSSTTQAFWQQETWWWHFKQSPDDLSAPVQWSLCSSPGGAMLRLPRGQPYLDGTLPGFFSTTCDLWLACDSLFNHRNANTILPLFSPKRNKVFWQLTAIFLFSTRFSSLTRRECATT